MTYDQYIEKLCVLLEKKGLKKDVVKRMTAKKIELLAKEENVIPKTDFTDLVLLHFGYVFIYKGQKR